MASPLSITLLVDKSCKRVIYAESDGGFVDILLSFLTLPLGSIPRLTKLPFGSIPNLWETVQNLSSDCFFSEACRSMLLRPVNSPPNPFTALPINDDDDNGPNSFPQFRYYYTCSQCISSLSFYPNIPCACGKLTDRKVEFVGDAVSGNYEPCVFVKPSFKFTITDGLLVYQSSTELAIDLFSKMDAKQRDSVESMRVDLTPEKVISFVID
ncbi:hypothetical protein KSP39_PZI004849 [Platanthera zijinensis]|uniref:DUF674 family protein n=1 Tax=Platanthera zijinensis TaxID=2320716 RepID=A0AAP0BTL1_9ASPA